MTKHTRFLAEDAIDYSDLEFPTRHLLRTMWSRADAKTGIIPRPISMTELAKRTGMSRKSVERHLNKAEEAGWLIRWPPEKKDAIQKHEANKYQLIMPGLVPQGPEASVSVTLDLGSQRRTVINQSTDLCFVCMKNERDPMFLGKPLCFECATS